MCVISMLKPHGQLVVQIEYKHVADVLYCSAVLMFFRTLLVKSKNGHERKKGWISGFTEAEGCFTCRNGSSKLKSFYLSKR